MQNCVRRLRSCTSGVGSGRAEIRTVIVVEATELGLRDDEVRVMESDEASLTAMRIGTGMIDAITIEMVRIAVVVAVIDTNGTIIGRGIAEVG